MVIKMYIIRASKPYFIFISCVHSFAFCNFLLADQPNCPPSLWNSPSQRHSWTKSGIPTDLGIFHPFWTNFASSTHFTHFGQKCQTLKSRHRAVISAYFTPFSWCSNNSLRWESGRNFSQTRKLSPPVVRFQIKQREVKLLAPWAAQYLTHHPVSQSNPIWDGAFSALLFLWQSQFFGNEHL